MAEKNGQLSRKGLLYSAVSAVLLAGCASHPLPVNYAPSSVMSASGSISISDFKYLPSDNDNVPKDCKNISDFKILPSDKDNVPEYCKNIFVAPNQIRNTAIGEIIIDRDVKTFVKDAVFAELRFVGIKTSNDNRFLKGDIEEFLIDDLGYSVDWKLRIKYEVVESSSKKVIYQATKSTERKTAKFANPFGALNETVKLNVEELIKDESFIQAIN